jgi:hypothetical protein
MILSSRLVSVLEVTDQQAMIRLKSREIVVRYLGHPLTRKVMSWRFEQMSVDIGEVTVDHLGRGYLGVSVFHGVNDTLDERRTITPRVSDEIVVLKDFQEFVDFSIHSFY